MELVNLSNDKVIAETVHQAYSFFKRLRGLMFTNELQSGTGLHIQPCPSVHTFFMKYAIDVIYINRENVVVGLDESLAPGRIGAQYPGAASVIELPVGTIRQTGTEIGNQLEFIPYKNF